MTFSTTFSEANHAAAAAGRTERPAAGRGYRRATNKVPVTFQNFAAPTRTIFTNQKTLQIRVKHIFHIDFLNQAQ